MDGREKAQAVFDEIGELPDGTAMPPKTAAAPYEASTPAADGPNGPLPLFSYCEAIYAASYTTAKATALQLSAHRCDDRTHV